MDSFYRPSKVGNKLHELLIPVACLLLNFLTKQNNEDFKPDNPTPAWQPHRHQTGYGSALKP